LTAELLKELEAELEQISLIPSEGGRFEVVVNDQLLYSKIENGRHARPGEVLGLVRNYLKERTK
jgi:selenoprotein W-related protein